MSYSLVAGDLGQDMLITLVVPAALAALPTAGSVQLFWTKPDGTTSRVSLTIVDPTATIEQLKRVWASGDTDQIGTHYGKVEVTDSNGKLITDPNDGSDLIWNIYAR